MELSDLESVRRRPQMYIGDLRTWGLRALLYEALGNALDEHLAGRTPRYVSEHRFRCKDGHWKWVQVRGMVIERDAAGQPLRMVVTHTDMTSAKDAEALRRAAVLADRQLRRGAAEETRRRHGIAAFVPHVAAAAIPDDPLAAVLGALPAHLREERVGPPLRDEHHPRAAALVGPRVEHLRGVHRVTHGVHQHGQRLPVHVEQGLEAQQPLAHHLVVIGHEHPDHVVTASGSDASTRVPWGVAGLTVSAPPTASARSRIPTIP